MNGWRWSDVYKQELGNILTSAGRHSGRPGHLMSALIRINITLLSNERMTRTLTGYVHLLRTWQAPLWPPLVMSCFELGKEMLLIWTVERRK